MKNASSLDVIECRGAKHLASPLAQDLSLSFAWRCQRSRMYHMATCMDLSANKKSLRFGVEERRIQLRKNQFATSNESTLRIKAELPSFSNYSIKICKQKSHLNIRTAAKDLGYCAYWIVWQFPCKLTFLYSPRVCVPNTVLRFRINNIFRRKWNFCIFKRVGPTKCQEKCSNM